MCVPQLFSQAHFLVFGSPKKSASLQFNNKFVLVKKKKAADICFCERHNPNKPETKTSKHKILRWF